MCFVLFNYLKDFHFQKSVKVLHLRVFVFSGSASQNHSFSKEGKNVRGFGQMFLMILLEIRYKFLLNFTRGVYGSLRYKLLLNCFCINEVCLIKRFGV